MLKGVSKLGNEFLKLEIFQYILFLKKFFGSGKFPEAPWTYLIVWFYHLLTYRIAGYFSEVQILANLATSFESQKYELPNIVTSLYSTSGKEVSRYYI